MQLFDRDDSLVPYLDCKPLQLVTAKKNKEKQKMETERERKRMFSRGINLKEEKEKNAVCCE